MFWTHKNSNHKSEHHGQHWVLFNPRHNIILDTHRPALRPTHSDHLTARHLVAVGSAILPKPAHSIRLPGARHGKIRRQNFSFNHSAHFFTNDISTNRKPSAPTPKKIVLLDMPMTEDVFSADVFVP